MTTQRKPNVPLEMYTVEEFCFAHRISITSFYELAKEGLGPDVIRIGRKPLISRESAAEWRSKMRNAAHP